MGAGALNQGECLLKKLSWRGNAYSRWALNGGNTVFSEKDRCIQFVILERKLLRNGCYHKGSSRGGWRRASASLLSHSMFSFLHGKESALYTAHNAIVSPDLKRS